MSKWPADIAAIIVVSDEVGPMILCSDTLSNAQDGVARLMALTAIVRNNSTYAVIKMEDLLQVCSYAA